MELAEYVITKRIEKLDKLKMDYLSKGDPVAYAQMWARLDELKGIQKEMEDLRKKGFNPFEEDK